MLILDLGWLSYGIAVTDPIVIALTIIRVTLETRN